MWAEEKKLAVSPPPDAPDYLGLSLLSNSHRVALGIASPPPEKAQRGSKGITALGSRTVRNAAFLLQQRYGIGRLGFYTFTLPPVDACSEYEAGREWAEIIRVFLQSVGRLLKAAGLPPSYVGCTEIQEGRYARYGGLPLHLHVVMVGKSRSGPWVITSDQWRALWRRAVIGRCRSFESVSFSASVDTARVKKSVEGYLGKYMSKGSKILGQLIADDPGLTEFLPRSWWCCSMNLRRAIARRMTGGNNTASKLLTDVRRDDSRVDYASEITVSMSDGQRVPVAVIGKLSAEGRNRYCWREGKAYLFD